VCARERAPCGTMTTHGLVRGISVTVGVPPVLSCCLPTYPCLRRDWHIMCPVQWSAVEWLHVLKPRCGAGSATAAPGAPRGAHRMALRHRTSALHISVRFLMQKHPQCSRTGRNVTVMVGPCPCRGGWDSSRAGLPFPNWPVHPKRGIAARFHLSLAPACALEVTHYWWLRRGSATTAVKKHC